MRLCTGVVVLCTNTDTRWSDVCTHTARASTTQKNTSILQLQRGARNARTTRCTISGICSARDRTIAAARMRHARARRVCWLLFKKPTNKPPRATAHSHHHHTTTPQLVIAHSRSSRDRATTHNTQQHASNKQHKALLLTIQRIHMHLAFLFSSSFRPSALAAGSVLLCCKQQHTRAPSGADQRATAPSETMNTAQRSNSDSSVQTTEAIGSCVCEFPCS